MLALCKLEAKEGGIGLREVDVPSPGAGEIRLKISAAGICGTDMQIYKWAPRIARRMRLPLVMGHEASGVVDALGSGVTDVSIGDHVSLESHVFCGHCKPCRSGKAHLCTNTTYPGIDFNGGFAEYAVVPAWRCVKLPAALSFEMAAASLFHGLTAHYLAHDVGELGPGRSCLVHAASGGIGQILVQLATRAGARVFATTSSEEKAAVARARGADVAVLYADGGFAEAVRAANGGEGVDVVFDPIGKATLRDSFRAARKRGLIIRNKMSAPRRRGSIRE